MPRLTVPTGTWLARMVRGALLASATAACDPCSGTLSCSDGPVLSYSGRILTPRTNRPVPDARVEFTRTGGVEIDPSTLSAVTNRNGEYLIYAAARDSGFVEGEVTIRSPSRDATQRIPVRLQTQRPGASLPLPDWTDVPFLQYFAEFYSRATGDRAEGVSVTFRRTGGIALARDTVQMTTDASGRVIIMPEPLAQGTVRGDLLVAEPGYAPSVIGGLELQTFSEPGQAVLLGPWGVGPSLAYYGIAVSENETPLLGYQVEVRRVGGIAAEPEQFTVTTEHLGHFGIRMRPREEGVLLLDFTFRSPTGEIYQFSGVEMPTFNSDEVRLLRRFVLPIK